MLKKFDKLINNSIMLAAVFLFMGMILIIFPELSILTISYIVSITLIVLGILLIFYSSDKLFFMNFLSLGVLQIVLGLILLIYPRSLSIFIPIALGVWMILKSSIDFRLSLILRNCGEKDWIYVLLLSSLAIICGFMLMANTKIGSITVTVVIGLFLCAYCLSNIVNNAIFKRNVNELGKQLGFVKK